MSLMDKQKLLFEIKGKTGFSHSCFLEKDVSLAIGELVKKIDKLAWDEGIGGYSSVDVDDVGKIINEVFGEID